jgi:hypothetical protein
MEVPLPEGARTSEADLEQLESAVRALVDLHFGCGRDWKAALRALEAEGWKVRCELVWRASAVRGHDYEEASGRTKGAALAALSQLTGLDALEGCP